MIRTMGTVTVLLVAQGLAALFPRGSWEWWFCVATIWTVITTMLWAIEKRLRRAEGRLARVEEVVDREFERYAA